MASVWRTAVGLVRITRPGNVALTAVSVYVGSVCAHAAWGHEVAIACLSAALIAAGGYVVNDVFDLEIDRVNRPLRPLPRGDLTHGMAVGWSVGLLLVGVGLAWMLDPASRSIAVAVVAGLVVYAARLKQTALAGHVTVATISALAFIYGGVLGTAVRMSFVPAMMAWAFHLGREMLKAAADREGDASGGADTMAVRWGVARTCRLATVPLVLVVAMSPWPAAWGWFGLPYLCMVLCGVDAVLAYVAWRAWRTPDVPTAARLADVLKWDMAAGLVAVGGDRWVDWLQAGGL